MRARTQPSTHTRVFKCTSSPVYLSPPPQGSFVFVKPTVQKHVSAYPSQKGASMSPTQVVVFLLPALALRRLVVH